VDLYGYEAGQWRWLSVTRPTAQSVEAKLAHGIAPGARPYVLYLPLYNGIKSLEIGVEQGAVFTPIPPRTQKPVVYYGTSIAQGACASRPGMAFTNILSRRMDRPFINLAFSGNGKMEREVADFLAEIDAGVYVIDCLPNMSVEETEKNPGPLVEILRRAHAKTPILFVEDRTFASAELLPEIRELHRKRRAALRGAFDAMAAAGVANLHYLGGENLLGSDTEGTTDGSHPNDLGMVRYADALEPVVKGLL
jgi:lysophospholipase L1-like esterase